MFVIYSDKFGRPFVLLSRFAVFHSLPSLDIDRGAVAPRTLSKPGAAITIAHNEVVLIKENNEL